MTKNRVMALALAAGMAVVGTNIALAQQAKPADGGKIAVKTADDLPRHTYKIDGKASELLKSDEQFKKLMTQVKSDIESDLAKYAISDPTTLIKMQNVLQTIAMLEGRLDDALAISNSSRQLEPKESKRYMMGVVLRSYAAASKASDGGKDKAKFESTFKESLNKEVSTFPWEQVREEVVQAKGRAEIVRAEMVLGMVEAQIDPTLVESKGEADADTARSLVAMRMTLDKMIPLMPMVGEVYGNIIESKKVVSKDIWAERAVTLSTKDAGTPVVVAIWDSGTDTEIFKDRVWTNSKETVNGKDDDGNGFVDDVHGIAYDLDAKSVPELLLPLTELKSPVAAVSQHMKGMMDLQAGIESAEKKALATYLQKLSQSEVGNFMQDLSLYGGYSHGTHVTGIALDGNPFARALPVRISFDFRNVPLHAPSVERAKTEAAAAAASVDYMKRAGVRVVNMSWGGSRADIENGLAQKGVGKDPAERAALSREIFGIQKTALERAMKSAPEILFVAAAGNSDNNNTFSELIPSGLNVDNMITVGAVDQSGKPTSFTTMGENVRFYANGFEVESYVPGGQRMKFSGTSMAAPNVANLAAKLIALNPKLTVKEVIAAIEKNGDPMAGDSKKVLINPKRTLGR